MGHMPSWGWSVIAIAMIMADLFLVAFGPGGRAISRSLYWPVVSVTVVTTLFSYLDQHRRPTKKLKLINLGTVILLLYVSLPIWHFGIELSGEPGIRPIMHGWINLVVLAIAVGVYFILQFATHSLRPENNAVEDKPERLTV